jgi:predicted glycosyltransferase
VRIAFTIQHPSNVHFFRHAIRELREADHETFVFAREKSVAVPLLEAYDIDHRVLADEPDGNLELALTQLAYEYRMWRAFRRVKPDVVMSNMGLAATHAAKLTGAEARTFIDTETENATQNRLVVPFADELYVPTWLRTDFGGRATRYEGMHEMAYTHPDWFEYDPATLEARGVDPEEPYYVVRFSAWEAHHDIGKRGFSPDGRKRLVRELADHGTVYVSDEAEGSIPEGGEPMPVEPHEFHQLLAGADGYVGEVATTTIEAALLGTPSVRVSPCAATDGGLIYLGDGGLVECSRPVLLLAECDRALELAADDDAESRWEERRAALFEDAVDVTRFVVEHATKPTGVSGRRRANETSDAASAEARR